MPTGPQQGYPCHPRPPCPLPCCPRSSPEQPPSASVTLLVINLLSCCLAQADSPHPQPVKSFLPLPKCFITDDSQHRYHYFFHMVVYIIVITVVADEDQDSQAWQVHKFIAAILDSFAVVLKVVQSLGCQIIKLTTTCMLSGESSSSGPQPSSGGRPARSASHRQADTAPSTGKAAATADTNGGSKRRLVVKPPRQQPDKQEEDSRASSSSEAEISDSDHSNERQPRIKLTIKGRPSNKSKDQADSAPQDSAADLSRAQKVVKGVLKLKAAAPFSRPVNEEEVPGYGAAVKQPMDLGSVLEKLNNAEYTSLGVECYFL